jgi:spermidine/putrescine transport system ATP-binding protein
METDRETSPCAVELVSISKYYGSLAALDDVSLQIRQGEFYTLLGPSGCGKTTTLNIIGGFIPISKGQLYINGKLVQNDPPYRRNVNTVFQNYALFPHMTVAQNIGFGPRMSKVPQEEIDRRVERMLALISLPGFGGRRPAQLSGGQQQRIALARALVNEPDVLLLDEPLGALDLKIRKQLQVELRNIQRQVGITFVYVTHDQEEAMVLSDRIAVMNKGKVIQEDTPTTIYHHPANRFVANFIGESNFFAGTVRGVANDQALVDIPGFVRPVRAMPQRPIGSGEEVTVMVRPERMAWRLGPAAGDRPALDNAAEGVVSKMAFLGMYTQIGAELADGSTVLIHQASKGESDSASRDLVGQRITIGWQIRDGQLLTD